MRHRHYLIILLAALAALRALYIWHTPFDLSPDEAHYWEWSRRLDLSYYSKGPAVAYVIAFFTRVFGDTAFGVRMGAVVFSTLASFVVFLFAKDAFKSEKAGFYSAALLNVTPIFSIGSILMTTDVLFIFFWALSAYCLMKALDGRAAGWWYAAGASIGLGFLSKYTIALLYPCLGLFLLASPRQRHWLLKKEPYLAGAVSLAAATPVIFWNILNGQVTIKHTMGQAHIGSGAFSFVPFLEFLGSQAGLLTPFILAAAAYGVWRAAREGFRGKDPGLLLTAFSSAPVFAFFLAVSLHGKVQANWAIAAYVTAIPAAVWAFGGLYGRRAEKRGLLALAAVITFAFGAALSALMFFPWVLEPLGAKRIMSGPPYNRVTGWEELGAKVSSVKEEFEKQGRVFIMSDTYQITSELAFYTMGKPVTYNVDAGSRRMNQYDLWPGLERLHGYNALYVKGGAAEAEKEVLDAFDKCDRQVFTVDWKEKPIKKFTIFRCYNYGGMKRDRPLTRY